MVDGGGGPVGAGDGVSGRRLARDLKRVGRLFFWGFFVLNIGGPMVALPVLAGVGVALLRRLQVVAPTAEVRRALVAVAVLVVVAAAVGALTLVPGADAGSWSALAAIAILLAAVAWTVALSGWARDLGLDVTARSFVRAGVAVGTTVTLLVGGLVTLVATVDRGPVRDHGRTRPEAFLGRPLDGPAAQWVAGAGAVSWLLAALLLTVALGRLRNGLEAAGDADLGRRAVTVPSR